MTISAMTAKSRRRNERTVKSGLVSSEHARLVLIFRRSSRSLSLVPRSLQHLARMLLRLFRRIVILDTSSDIAWDRNTK